MVRAEVIRRRFQKLGEYLDILERMRRYSREECLADPEHYGAAERFLQLSTETADDLASHVIADDNLGAVENARDLAHVFRRNGLVDQGLEDK